ncbi:universal stress protein [Limobrevibacterium gyesilva]|uniref:Universal stress protein n=1 Tax=Limobrevibacterium gyesilva TaxID=2991712 RepID=A0AA41YM64_9PROT|nr:universal stress protein [Limobrevibacterium gyesilva]MCW3475046.1 universal stress protein [Limobrevibacterium gyesilva]
MPIKDILVHLDTSPRSDVRLTLAAGLAARHEANLIGLHVVELPPPDMFYGFPTAFMDLERAEDVIDRLRAARLEEAARIEAAFRDRLRRDGLSGEWRLVEGDVGETLALHTRYADLVILGQPDPDTPAGPAANVPVPALMTSGRPILMVPFAGTFPAIGERVLVGWNASAESARALNDAIPLLLHAKKVTVLAINPRRGIAGDGDVPAADIALHLARHGIKAEAAHTVAVDISEGDALLSYAADLGADMLVCGMYGHSRLRELVFGGVTRNLLSHMTVPVFMSH